MPKVLVVEDNEMNRDMLARRLQRQGYEICVAADGPSGVALASSEAPDIILMDINLGAMDGWEATRRIKVNPTTRSIPVIALTARAVASDRGKSVQVGCADFDTKPVNLPRLLEKMSACLRRAA
jgi:CheY-like chemotaxis protein